MEAMTIGVLARRAGVGVETVRYYQRRDLLPVPRSFRGAYRVYGPEHADRIRFIKRAQDLGFTLEEVAELLCLNDGTGRARARQIAAAKIAQIEAKLVDLERIVAALRGLLEACVHTGVAEPCPIIHLLASAG